MCVYVKIGIYMCSYIYICMYVCVFQYYSLLEYAHNHTHHVRISNYIHVYDYTSVVCRRVSWVSLCPCFNAVDIYNHTYSIYKYVCLRISIL
jgi:hypothetical protein